MFEYLSWTSLLWAALFAALIPLVIPRFRDPQKRLHALHTLYLDSSGEDIATSNSVYHALSAALPDSVFKKSSLTYASSVTSYWSLQACETVPLCVVRPRDTEEVSTAIRLLRQRFDLQPDHDPKPVKFTVKSGGHTPETGFANVQGGVVIDLSLLNGVNVSHNSTSAVIGSGARWSDVSSKLDKMGLAVAGGRNSTVGVGGLILGGGISFFSPQVGFVCSNILEYEIVLADGSITTATESQNADLWRALKGGSGNFGIVTQFTARTFPSAKIWSGHIYAMGSKAPQYIDAFHDFLAAEERDEHAAGPIVAFGYAQKWRINAISTQVAYTKPQKWPPAWDKFKSLPRLWSTAKIQDLSSATDELAANAPMGLRQFFATTTMKNDLDTLHQAYNAFTESVKNVRSVRGLTYAIVFQPISKQTMRKGDPNALGLASRDSPLVILLMTVSWTKAEDDAFMEKETRGIIDKVDTFAKSKGTDDPYRYLNYAASSQDPFSGYGEEMKTFLIETSRRYDPSRFFQKANVGGFKLDVD